MLRWAIPLCLAGLGLSSLAAASPEFDPWSEPATYAFEYRVDLAPLRTGEPKPARLWLPAPSDGPSQRVLSSDIQAPVPHRETRDSIGNRIVYLELPGGGPEAASESASEVVMRFVVQRLPYRGIPAQEAGAGGPHDPQRFLRPARRIPLDGLVRQIALQEAAGHESPAEKIRAFYDYVVRTMAYSKKGKGWGQGDAIWACTSKYGNCTDFHSLFIGMARSQGIPARFVIGFPIPASREEGEIPGYHCWAEVFDAGRGWLPLDSSEAKKSGRVDDYFGFLPSDRIEFTVGRDLELEPRQQGDPLNYFIYPYAEVDGAPVEKLPVRFHFWRLPRTTVSAVVGAGEEGVRVE